MIPYIQLKSHLFSELPSSVSATMLVAADHSDIKVGADATVLGNNIPPNTIVVAIDSFAITLSTSYL